MNIYGYENFGYEGNIISVEVDVRKGIPSVDIVGLADGAVKESRERMRSAIRNSGFVFPPERVLISLSPADLKKEGSCYDLAMALSVLDSTGEYGFIEAEVLVLGELGLSGNVRPVRGVNAAVSSAVEKGIRFVIVPAANVNEVNGFDVKIVGVETLYQAVDALRNVGFFHRLESEKVKAQSVEFNDDEDRVEMCNELRLPKRLVRAIEIAVAGKHNLLVTGRPGCGKTVAINTLVPLLTPKLTVEESQPVTRIWSLAGLMKPNDELLRTAPFRIPHQTATIEGICGGGLHCSPGEISLAHNGILFLDEAAEFRSIVLQMLRVPLESKHITLSRAGRTTVYPANFQLIMASNPCPCGNLGSKDRLCLCSAKSVEMYWRKFSAPLIDRIGVILNIDDEDEKVAVDIGELRNHVIKAFEIQRKKSLYNNSLPVQGLASSFDSEAVKLYEKHFSENCLSERKMANILRVAITIANMDGRESVSCDDVREAVSFSENEVMKS